MTDEQLEKIAWLNRAFHAEKDVNALSSLLKRDKERAKDISANYDKNDKGKSDSRTNGMEEALLMLAETEEKYNRALTEYTRCRKEIEAAIEALHESDIKSIFKYRYVECKTMKEIAKEMHYDIKTIRRKHEKGLEKMSPFVLECPPLTVI